MTLFVNAANVHQGGGRNLLASLLATLGGTPATIIMDSRFPLEGVPLSNLTIRRVAARLVTRFAAERWLAKNVLEGDHLLCFGNLPPLFRSRGRVIVFVQNRLLIDPSPVGHFPLRARLRHAIERLWLRRRAGNADLFVVQTPSMLAAAQASGILAGKPIEVRPFVPEQQHANRGEFRPRDAEPRSPRFVYVSSGEVHKNHRRLVEAWVELAAMGLRPQLDLTIGDEAPELCRWIESTVRRFDLPIVNRGQVPPSKIAKLLAEADAVIFPSMMESFGLPLLEARAAGLPIIAAELDYVRDVANPVETFDPQSTLSIARAVARFLGASPPPLSPLSARDFAESLGLVPSTGSMSRTSSPLPL